MTNRRRSDRISNEFGGMIAIIAFEAGAGSALWGEYLVTVQTLENAFDAVRHGRGYTHELHVFGLSPEVAVTYDRNLFEQPGLKPLTPSSVGFQLVAESDQAAFDTANTLAERMQSGSLSPDDPSDIAWATALEQAVSLRPSLVSFNKDSSRIAS